MKISCGRIKALGLVIVPHSYIWEHGDKMEAYGESRWHWMHPARSLLDLNIPMAGHSDSPISAAETLLRIQDMRLTQPVNLANDAATNSLSRTITLAKAHGLNSRNPDDGNPSRKTGIPTWRITSTNWPVVQFHEGDVA